MIIGLSTAIMFALIVLRPKPAKKVPEVVAALVETMVAQPRKERISVTAFGSIQADQTVDMQPQVSGRVIVLSPNLVLGGLVEKDEALLKIDPADFQLAIEQAEAAVTRAQFELEVEQGRQIVAKREWELLDPSLKSTEMGGDLALRRPHLKEKQASLRSAQSTLEKAKLDYERTELKAPFQALVLREMAEVGQLVTPQTNVATLVATEAFRVQVSIPYAWLKWITVPRTEDETGSLAVIKREVGSSDALIRYGYVIRILGDLDPNGRMVRLLVRVDDPLGLRNEELRDSPLLLDTYVRVELLGPFVDNVYVIPRKAVREGDKVWIINNENQLEVKPINVLFGRETDVVVDRGVLPGDRIVTSPIPTAIPGMLLKAIDEPS